MSSESTLNRNQFYLSVLFNFFLLKIVNYEQEIGEHKEHIKRGIEMCN